MFLSRPNVLCEPLRPQPDPQVLRRLRAHENSIATTAMVVHELLFSPLSGLTVEDWRAG
jgi:tRNA(fMet)-specific endonuclease VapC